MEIIGKSVTQRITDVKQPHGGFVKASNFHTEILSDGLTLYPNENIHASLIGMCVDYLSRFMLGANVEDSFFIPLMGSKIAMEYTGDESYFTRALSSLNKIVGLDDESIIHAAKLVSYDVWFRNSHAIALRSTDLDQINPDANTVSNIRLLVERTVRFYTDYGPITTDGFTFDPNGYTDLVVAGDGDFLTEDTLWDLKVRRSKIDSKTSLQLMMYYLMGKRSGQDIFDSIQRIGIFNPRLHIVQTLDVSDVSSDVIETIEKEVIGYK